MEQQKACDALTAMVSKDEMNINLKKVLWEQWLVKKRVALSVQRRRYVLDEEHLVNQVLKLSCTFFIALKNF